MMHIFYKANLVESETDVEGIAFGNTTGEVVENILDQYGFDDVEKLTIWFPEFTDSSIVEYEEILECPLFDK